MKPAPFAYFDPETPEEVLELLREHGDDAKLIAGGQTLGPMLNMRLLAPEALIDLNRVAALGGRRSEDGWTVLGALTRQSTLEDDPDLPAAQPLVAAAIPHIAHRAIRNRGTVGGSLAHADPAAEWGALALALEARMLIHRADGEPRSVPAGQFFTGLLSTVLEPGDLLEEIRLPPWPAGAGWSFREFSRRHGDFALAGAAVVLGLDAGGACREARIALLGVGDRPLRAGAAERLLAGERPATDLLGAAAEQAAHAVDPQSDLHASADFRRHLVRVMVEDALAEAAGRARGGTVDGGG